MNDQINEPIEVIASFKKDGLIPHSFSWRRKIYKIDKVHLVHTSQAGRALIYHFSVTDAANYFQLAFNPFNLSWVLETVYSEG
ncbi:MAG: hypothetical protein WCV73_00455 [Patescibacteria group bacterium]|jgi:hypothetical protein